VNRFNFTTFLTSNTNLDQVFLDELFSNCSIRKYAKGEFLLRPNQKCEHSFFVEKGLLKQYHIDEKGKEHILQFAPENWFVADRESAYFDNPSLYFIQAIEDSAVFLIDENFILSLSASTPAFLKFNHTLLHNHIRHLQKRIMMLLSATAEERYLNFISIYPDLTLRVSQIMIASYLGITPESLSRVRKDLAKRNHHTQNLS